VDTTATAANLSEAIMSGDSTLTCVPNAAVITVSNQAPGTVGNAVALSVAASNAHVTGSGVNLANGSATSAIMISVDTTGTTLLVFWYNKPVPY
jgi:hypothetical protein